MGGILRVVIRLPRRAQARDWHDDYAPGTLPAGWGFDALRYSYDCDPSSGGRG